MSKINIHSCPNINGKLQCELVYYGHLTNQTYTYIITVLIIFQVLYMIKTITVCVNYKAALIVKCLG